MNSSSVISPSSQLLLDGIKLAFAQIHKRFDESNARMERCFSRTLAVLEQQGTAVEPRIGGPQQFGATQLVVADNWGGLFGGDDNSIAAATDAPVVADNWGGLFDGDDSIAPVLSARLASGQDEPCSLLVLAPLPAPRPIESGSEVSGSATVTPYVSALVTPTPATPPPPSATPDPPFVLPQEYERSFQLLREKLPGEDMETVEEALFNREPKMLALARPPLSCVVPFAPAPAPDDALDSEPSDAAGATLHLFSVNYFVDGCMGSILLDSTTGNNAEKVAQQVAEHFGFLVARVELVRHAAIVRAEGLGASGRVHIGANLESHGLLMYHFVCRDRFLMANAAAAVESELRAIAVSHIFSALPDPLCSVHLGCCYEDEPRPKPRFCLGPVQCVLRAVTLGGYDVSLDDDPAAPARHHWVALQATQCAIELVPDFLELAYLHAMLLFIVTKEHGSLGARQVFEVLSLHAAISCNICISFELLGHMTIGANQQRSWPPLDELRLLSCDAGMRPLPWPSFHKQLLTCVLVLLLGMVDGCLMIWYFCFPWKPPWSWKPQCLPSVRRLINGGDDLGAIARELSYSYQPTVVPSELMVFNVEAEPTEWQIWTAHFILRCNVRFLTESSNKGPQFSFLVSWRLDVVESAPTFGNGIFRKHDYKTALRKYRKSMCSVRIHWGDGSADQVMRNMLATECVRSFHMGFSAGLLRQEAYMTACVGLIAGAIGACVGSPADLALITMQADSTLPAAHRHNYKDAFHALYRITADEGVLVLWNGAGPTVVRAKALNMCWVVVQYKPPWPPPCQLEMQRNGVQPRPTPWPFFRSHTVSMHWQQSLLLVLRSVGFLMKSYSQHTNPLPTYSVIGR